MQEAATKITADATKAAGGAAAPAPAASADKSGGGGGGGLANASKEELVEVLQKMNKKVKALSALRAQLTDKLQKTELERDKLVIFSKE